MERNSLLSISPIDGRYIDLTEEISEYFSEYAIIKYRVIVEIKWLIRLLKNNLIMQEGCSENDINLIENIIHKFNLSEAEEVKKIEEITKHDVKAVEYYLRDKLKEIKLEKYNYLIHFGCTSEDISNLAYGIMINNLKKEILIPNIEEMVNSVKERAINLRDIPMLAHTHGQPASPTTVGKELSIFVYRWNSILSYIKNIKLKGKFSGAVGNYNAQIVSYPNIDWIDFSKEFIQELDLEFNPLTTQIESHDTISLLFSYIKLFNNITMDFNSDMWIYISKNYFKQRPIKTEIGSSVMPHKVNPINHENSMANIRMANSIFDTLSNNLQISRMQRDLSDSSMLRNIGVGIAHTMISIKQTIIAINKTEVNEEILYKELEENPEVLSEAIQTVLRKNKYQNAYEILKEFTRGKRMSIEKIHQFVNNLDILEEDKVNLLKLKPSNYIGLAEQLVDYMSVL